MDARQVIINGLPYYVPAGELADHRDYDGPSCGAVAPEAWGSQVCDVAPHGNAVLHVAHDEGHVTALWADWLTADPVERAEAADLGGEAWGRHLDGEPGSARWAICQPGR